MWTTVPPAKSRAPPAADARVLAAVGQDSAAPDPMAQRAIDQRAPEDHEHDHRAELHPLGKRPADQRRGDDEEHALEQHVRQPGDVQVGKHRNVGLPIDQRRLHAVHQQVVEIADPGPAAAEGKRVSPECPDDRHQTHQEHALHHHAQHVLLSDQSAVEQGQARAGHHQDQRRAGQEPGVAARIDRRGLRGRAADWAGVWSVDDAPGSSPGDSARTSVGAAAPSANSKATIASHLPTRKRVFHPSNCLSTL